VKQGEMKLVFINSKYIY